MKFVRLTVITSAAVVLSAGAAMAQDGGGGPSEGPGRWQGPGRWGQQDRGMSGQHMRMRRPGMHHRMHDPVARLLDHQTALHLSPTQVNNIIAIDEKLHNDNKPLMEQLMAMHMNRMHRGGDGGDSANRAGPSTAQRDSAMTTMRSIRENVWRATAAADAVLTPEQLNTAGMLHRAGPPGIGMRRGMGNGPAPDPR
jgi:hypothetical protein